MTDSDDELFPVRLHGGQPVLRKVRDMTPGEVVAAIDLAGGEKLARLLRIIAETHPVFRADP